MFLIFNEILLMEPAPPQHFACYKQEGKDVTCHHKPDCLFTCSLAQYIVMLSKNRTTNWVEGGKSVTFLGAMLGSSLCISTVGVSNSNWCHQLRLSCLSRNEPQNVKAN